MAYTLGGAARAAGKSKPTIAKAIKAGRIPAGRAEDGSYQIDPVELHRVYPFAEKAGGNGLQQGTPADTPAAAGGLSGELDQWRTLAIEREETIADLRRRLDTGDGERRQLSEVLYRLTKALTDRPAPELAPPAVSWPRRAWRWARSSA